MIKFYKTNRDIQLEWMKKNPGKTVTLNVALVLLYFVYLEWMNRDVHTSFFYKESNDTE